MTYLSPKPLTRLVRVVTHDADPDALPDSSRSSPTKAIVVRQDATTITIYEGKDNANVLEAEPDMEETRRVHRMVMLTQHKIEEFLRN